MFQTVADIYIFEAKRHAFGRAFSLWKILSTVVRVFKNVSQIFYMFLFGGAELFRRRSQWENESGAK